MAARPFFLRYHHDVRFSVEKIPSSSIMMPQEVINPGHGTATLGDAMKSLVVKRSVVVAGHKTSVSLEDAFWKSLKEIAACGDMSVSALLAAIDSARRHGNLSSAIRLFVLTFYREQLLDQLDVRDKPEAIQALISRSAQKSSTSAPSE